jgi:transposase
MDYGAIDLHKKESQVRIVTDSGEIVDQRIVTARDRFTQVFWGRPRMRILVEASTESEWVAQHLEQLGHEVIVADPNYAPMYGHRSRRIKTDRRDVVALTEACQHGTYRPAHRRSARQHEVQCQLNVRAELTAARSRAISLARAITRAAGLRIRSGEAETFLTRLAALELSASMTTTLAPLCREIEVLNDELVRADEHFVTMVADDPTVKRLTTVPGIGPITASAFVAALDVADRFERAGQVTSYLGLVPQEYSSGERQRRGHLLRSAHPQLQSLLVQAALRMSRSTDPRTATLRAWAEAIGRRRGKKIAMVALARRLARILFAMWRDQTDYQPKGFRVRQPDPVSELTSDTRTAAHRARFRSASSSWRSKRVRGRGRT